MPSGTGGGPSPFVQAVTAIYSAVTSYFSSTPTNSTATQCTNPSVYSKPQSSKTQLTSSPPAGAPPLDQATKDRIKAIPKGQRPDPSTYMTPDQINEHLAKFDKGASRFMTQGNLTKYGPSQRDGTSFMMPSSEADAVLAKANGDPEKLEDALGLPRGTLNNNPLVRVDVPSPRQLGLRVPSGNEAGANDLWIPGGKLPDGTSEAVLDLAKAPPGSFKATPI
jgi:hypothetical protein